MSHARAVISESQAAALALELYGVQGAATELNGELDRNFCIRTEDGRYVLKVVRHAMASDLLDLWVRVLAHLGADRMSVPVVVPTTAGESWGKVTAEDGREHMVWLTTWVDGIPLVECSERPLEWMHQLGACLGRIQVSIRSFDHPALERNFEWDLRVGEDVCRRHLHQIQNPEDRQVIRESLAGIGVVLDSVGEVLRVGPVHGDANDHNWIIQPDNFTAPISGLIDVGDAGRSWVLGDVAIACGYAMLNQSDPVAVAAEILRGYHAVDPIPEVELPALWELARLRLCVSVSMSALQQKREPGNPYLSATAGPALQLLRRLLRISSDQVLQRFRGVCGLCP
jgi:Ser/Thr protein kinase RdoA (MazF antagonist)